MMKKTIYLLIAVAMLLAMFPQPATADDPEPGIGMYVANMQYLGQVRPNDKVVNYVRVTIRDVAGLPVKSARVTLFQALNENGTAIQEVLTATTNSSGIANFQVTVTVHPTYFIVYDVVKTNYSYVPSMNIETILIVP
jgi:hypothetical protein